MPYSGEALTADCYEGTTCLINRLNIRDEKMLAAVEADITVAKTMTLVKDPLQGNFDFDHYKAIHRFLFEDLYDWAGQIRTVNMSKKGTSFVKAEEIERIAENCFQRLKTKQFFVGLSFDSFVDEIVDFYCTTNLLHPFREGNGRTQKIFICQLAENAGYHIDFNKMDADDLMVATIYAAQGISDHLLRLFHENTTKKEPAC